MYYFGKECKILESNKISSLILINGKEYKVRNELIHDFYRTETYNVTCSISNCFYFKDLIDLSECVLTDNDLLKWMGYLKRSFDKCFELKETYNNLLEIYNINFDFFQRNSNYIFYESFAYTICTFDNLERLIDLHFDKLLEHNRPDILFSVMIKYQKLSEQFIIKYLNYFNSNHIQEISSYQKHLSKEFINRLKIYEKLNI